MPDNNLKTIREIINEVSFKLDHADLYYGHGTDNAFDEAVYLVLATLDLPFDIDEPGLNEIVSADTYQDIHERVQRRINDRVPVAYLVNKAWFCGNSFYVDERVLIPRSPIAELIEDGFS
ncbi:MAG: 50S ribosomal protein L3 N(5)-glutamine methyltransferase, partial [Gammaproteobacteria bacterium]|nr:50S ribosomal protein L3 N(5)-glutamine methyltransferase [Gammaproteobacteria bacterium]